MKEKPIGKKKARTTWRFIALAGVAFMAIVLWFLWFDIAGEFEDSKISVGEARDGILVA